MTEHDYVAWLMSMIGYGLQPGEYVPGTDPLTVMTR